MMNPTPSRQTGSDQDLDEIKQGQQPLVKVLRGKHTLLAFVIRSCREDREGSLGGEGLYWPRSTAYECKCASVNL